MIRSTQERFIFIIPKESKEAHEFRSKLEELKYAYAMTTDSVSIIFQLNVQNTKIDVKVLDDYLKERGLING